MSKPFRFHPDAREEFRGAIAWYWERNPSVAVDFRLTVSEAIRTVARASNRWPKHLHGTRRFLLRRFPFAIIYLDEPALVNVIAVAHHKRRPGYWKERI